MVGGYGTGSGFSMESIEPRPFNKEEVLNDIRERFKKYNDTWGTFSNCEKCKGKGHWMELRGDKEYQIMCECWELKRKQRVVDNAGIKLDVGKGLLSNFETEYPFQKIMKKKAIDFLQDDNPIMFYVSGTSGCGKTTLINGMMAKYIMDGENPIIMRWMSDSSKLKASYNTTEFSDIYNQYATCHILIIDDLLKCVGNDKPTDADMRLVRMLVDDRMYGNRITLITSEIPPSTFNKVDDSLASRIYEATKHGEYCCHTKEAPNLRYKQMKV